MEQQILWQPWNRPGLEHLHLVQKQESIVADGLILGVQEQEPFRLHYTISCDSQWRVQVVHLSLFPGLLSSLHLIADGEGTWTNEQGAVLPLLQGCLDVDISATPFTNTLPIRRLALSPGTTATLSMVYIAVPSMQIEVTQQRYTCLSVTPSGGQYRFESLKQGIQTFTADLPVDQDGIVLDYPELFRRVGAWRSHGN